MSAFAILAGAPEPLGLTLTGDGANVAIASESAEKIELCLFEGQREIARLALPGKTGPVFHGFVPGLSAGALYGFRAHGPWRPSEGLRFNPQKLLLDPHALALDGPIKLHDSLFASSPEDSAAFAPKAVATSPQIAQPMRRKIPWSETVIYELHVRGFTRTLDNVPESLRGTFAGLAHPAAVAHLKQLDMTTLEIMPCAAWIDERHLRAVGLTNYWGYNPIAMMTPDPRLAPGGWRELRESVVALQSEGFEVVIDVVLNHTGESDKDGPTLCLRGLDNPTYYRLDPANPSRYVDDAGCGNILRLDHPATLRYTMDALRAWALYGGVDGFRFDLATTLGRRAEGFDAHAPLLAAIAQDPLLRELKLIAEPWDIGPGGYRIGRFPALWGEWNDKFRDAARKFWRGDPGTIGELATRLAGSEDLFGARKPPSRSVNFVTAHDGFTLADLVSYERKHNEANGENNRDGTDANHSWNNGAEGDTADENILAARRRDQRNLLTTLLLARGTPMLAMGAEFGQSQRGNNNAYAQDNPTAWLDWQNADRNLIAFTCALIALRRTTPAFTQDRFLTGAPCGDETPDVEWRGADGEILNEAQWREGERRFLAALFCAPAIRPLRGHEAAIPIPPPCGEGGERIGRCETPVLPGELWRVGWGSRAALLLNAAWEPAVFRLPQPRQSFLWRRSLDTSVEDGAGDGACFDCGETLVVAPRSTLVLIETPEAQATRLDEAPQPETIDALARAAGITPDWHDIDGTHHIVPGSTKRALLKALGLSAETQREARASLKRLADERDRRVLPFALVAHDSEKIEAPLVIEEPHADLDLVDEMGARRRIAIGAGAFRREEKRACDGGAFVAYVATLPPLPIGRYTLSLAQDLETLCHLTIAPRACCWPDALDAPATGISVQLYSLRRESDQGIGDFTTLAELAEAAGRAGHAAVGINPLHALFTENRKRASPYHPSDRNFLDPIYLDLDTLSEITGLPCELDAETRALAKALSQKNEVDYPAVWALKAQAITAHFHAFEEAAKADPNFAPAHDFTAFIEEEGERLRLFATNQAKARRFGRTDAQKPELTTIVMPGHDGPALRDQDIYAVCFEQWLCDHQLARAAERGRASGLRLGLYRDLAVGAAPDGAEVRAEDDLFMRSVSVGAPPDPFAEGGQIWRLPPPNPLAMAHDGYAAFAGLLRENMRHAGALRIDHVMALMRLFVVPEGAPALEGAYLSYPLDDLLGELALESHRAKCVVIGEDLGTVPAGFREKMAAANVLSYRVLWFERWAEDFAPPTAYPPRAAACASTHDLPTLAGWWAGADIEEKAALSLISSEAAGLDRQRRRDDKARLLKALSAEGLREASPDQPFDPALIAAVHAFIAKTPSALAMFQLDDLLGETVSVNLPGTDRERPNWRRKLSRAATSHILRMAALRRRS